MKLLLDEMYPSTLSAALKAAGIDATAVGALGLTARSDAEVFATAVAGDHALLTENVADFTRLAAEWIANGNHHPGLLIALSSRFSRRPSGIKPLAAAVKAVVHQQLDDRVVYLRRAV
ncbi:DUF5615 family PIN-like protein [Mycobacterium celatum]|uniref:DUF5615 domain-containing protein n=1 Tax=Mycobacterium celatum TaxID=28045 RepID=A0A1X1RKI6_MYCCE|nr:DUF5615 family PIN-like protein [Mycobacterium celatum]ORV08320.1 hypothetical protein AWB95_19625 [Mycobacterium celatum]PIB78568.1 hypothetical protein CQY23_12840 [Mycobacterium celatum]